LATGGIHSTGDRDFSAYRLRFSWIRWKSRFAFHNEPAMKNGRAGSAVALRFGSGPVHRSIDTDSGAPKAETHVPAPRQFAQLQPPPLMQAERAGQAPEDV
jgi:hypothetical protein